MKTIIITVLLLFNFNANSQVTLEKTYDSAMINLYIVNLEKAGQKYIRIIREFYVDTSAFRFTLYNLDHSIYKEVKLNTLPRFSTIVFGSPVSATNNFDILYVSQNLFDQDDGVEFMYTYGFNPNPFVPIDSPVTFTGIYNDDLSPIFTIYNYIPYIRSNFPQVMYPIYNTPDGAKLILSSANGDRKARVYGLVGKLTAGIARPNGQDDPAFSIYPNPSSGLVTINFNVPKHSKSSFIRIFNSAGSLVKTYEVDNTFNDLMLDNSEFSNGVYICQVEVDGSVIESKKIIINK